MAGQKNVFVGGEDYICFMLVRNLSISFLERREKPLAVFLKARSVSNLVCVLYLVHGGF